MKPLSLYIHWPFCVSKCPYCDFNSHVRESIDENQWRQALLKELDYWGERTKGRPLTTLFFGGGTPSLMSPQTVEALIDKACQIWSPENLEITLEANPNSIDLEKFKAFAHAGVNRVSVGIQSLDPDVLKFLGRTHSKDEAIRAIEIARQTFDRYSFDLIYARPDQNWDMWEKELMKALPLVGEHMSLYQLTIEPQTAFYTAYQRGDWKLPSEEVQALLYQNTNSLLKSHGLNAYEVSNYAKPGQECRHNLAYWRYQDYIPIGPGAHGRMQFLDIPKRFQNMDSKMRVEGAECTLLHEHPESPIFSKTHSLKDEGYKQALRNYKAPETWLSKVMETGHGLQEALDLSTQEQFTEALLMGLRLFEGIPFERLSAIDPIRFQSLAAPLKDLQHQGILKPSTTHLTVEPQHMLVLNYIVERLNRS